MENYKNNTDAQEGQSVKNESWTTDSQRPPVQKNPYDDSQEIEDDSSDLYPKNESSLDTSNSYDENEDDEDEDEDNNDDEDDNDLENDPFEEEGGFEEKDIDYREKREKDAF